MKPGQILIAVIMLLVAAEGIIALFKVRGPAADADDEPAAENVPTIVSVQVGVLTNVTLHRYISGYGMIEAAPATANQPAAGGSLAVPTAGIVAKINVVAGQHVRKGDLLMEINSAAATFDFAKAEVERQGKLFAQQNTSLKNLEDARAQLASLEVIAPVSGTVTRLNVQPGQAVDATSTVAEVIDLNRLAVSVKVPATQAEQLAAGQEVQIQSDPPVTVPLTFVSPSVDPSDGTVLAWALLPPASGLRPGRFVQIKIVSATQSNCLAAPVQSVVTDENGESSIWLVNSNQATQTSVETGLHDEGWVEIRSLVLKAGDPIVTAGAYGLPEKTQIKIVNPSHETVAPDSSH